MRPHVTVGAYSLVLVAITAGDTGGNREPQGTSMESASERYVRGVSLLKLVGGRDYDAPFAQLEAIAPDLRRFTVEFAYGDVMSRSALDLKTRQIATVAALAAMGKAQPQLRYHIEGALNVGCEPSSVIEAILLSTVYAGFPAALNGTLAAKDVFQQRGVLSDSRAVTASGNDRYERGLRALQEVSGASGAEVVRSLEDVAPDLGRFVIEFSYGDVISRTGLDYRSRELATVALLTALGTAEPQLRVHINAALNVGASREEIVEVIQQMAVYAGFPAALNGIAAARDVFSARG